MTEEENLPRATKIEVAAWKALAMDARQASVLLMRGVPRAKVLAVLTLSDPELDVITATILGTLGLDNVVQLAHYGIRNCLVGVNKRDERKATTA
jgi:hypothetical protein